MKTKEIKKLESLFKTENEHWNMFIFEMLCKVIQQDQFEKPETPLQLFSEAIELFTENSEQPLQAIHSFNEILQKHELNDSQTLFILNSVFNYLNQTAFDGIDLNEVCELLKSQKESIRTKLSAIKPKNPVRETLKQMLQAELNILPETLKTLEPAQRLNIVCKLLPFIIPKMDSISNETHIRTGFNS